MTEQECEITPSEGKELSVAEELKCLELGETEIFLLSSLREHDEPTYMHSIGTFILARDRIGKNPRIQSLIDDEKVPLSTFYQACLLHDVGKTTIPNFILNNTATNSELIDKFAQMIIDEPERAATIRSGLTPEELSFLKTKNKEEVIDYLAQKDMRPFLFLPASVVLSPEETAQLQARGFSADAPLGGIIARHEQESQRILEENGMDLVAALAGRHHRGVELNDPKEVFDLTKSIASLNISQTLSSNLIHIIDIQQAVGEGRAYQEKQGNPLLEAIYTIVAQTKRGKIDPGATKIWLEGEIGRIGEFEQSPKTLRWKQEIDQFMLG